MRFFKTLTLTVVALFAMTAACLAAPPPLFSDARGHGAFLEQVEHTLNSADGLGVQVLGAEPTKRPNAWRVNMSCGVMVVDETDGP